MNFLEASLEQVDILNAIYNIGPWDTKKMLMSEALSNSPGEFGALTSKDADRTIAYGNEVIVDHGHDPVVPTSFAEGKCDDLWREDKDVPERDFHDLLDGDEFTIAANDQFLEQSMDAHDIISEMELDEPDDDF